MKKIKSLFLLFIIAISINGCFKPVTPASYIAAHNDKEMASAFSTFLNVKSVYTYSDKDTLRTSTVVVPFSEHVMLGNARNHLMENGQNNIIFNTYKDVVKKRGNILAVYRGALNTAIFSGLANTRDLKTFDKTYMEYYYYDTLPVYIEFDKTSNKMISILYSFTKVSVAFNQVNDPMAPVDVDLKTFVQSGSKLNIIKNIVSNSTFEDNFLRKE